ncbi:hypothetical protein CEXT_722801 [Caerostris extrusa]|uniref:Uncharacterized protein n=1 Tax=Caerostris extrusa TaxID=172846 RepID=A0AAV4RCL8_CAEEX|nr:hypothetical protein CEXT_722801 [Caerostris extrusa]
MMHLSPATAHVGISNSELLCSPLIHCFDRGTPGFDHYTEDIPITIISSHYYRSVTERNHIVVAKRDTCCSFPPGSGLLVIIRLRSLGERHFQRTLALQYKEHPHLKRSNTAKFASILSLHIYEDSVAETGCCVIPRRHH